MQIKSFNISKEIAMVLSPEIKVTTEILWQGALIFALIDAVFVAFLIRSIEPARLREIKWALITVMAIFFCGLFGILASYIFWELVYQYVFPAWARWIMPPVYGLLFAAIGLLFWWLSFRIRGNAIANFCLLGGLWGIISHLWAIYRGILDKPPMLQGASPVAAVVVAAFEFIFYWCVCLSLTILFQQAWRWSRNLRQPQV
jgi:hypothetical protein